jgi:hypothetical protein
METSLIACWRIDQRNRRRGRERILNEFF